ncbi:wall-associated receptor kinase-like 22 [Cryptomeria japonica]|uniref:wall-associated receptor kinase-like 22 n=1 Tax=Cryptomeria japonica TaxID=3369 RepID=UPI0027DA692D|nr:wall-associated receptor kinase-like 22 [Cryptomeria japonica]XP_059076162.1 wall-associated receptor kinase-like 22 [Cryptomeria japonica]XP_059076163.1 wall-associated receptor kinase-like 22 [Cryptomeria japonica]
MVFTSADCNPDSRGFGISTFWSISTIFHRDVKSSNILLNERLSPKLADFGISRLISASNKTHLTTNIMGTRGYLDPEYFQTYQLTDKSDVYSFGVVLVELLTSLEPISIERVSDEWNLSNLFLSRFNDNRLTEILDSKVLEEKNLQQMKDMGRLARECLHLERRKRPLMKEVVEELFWIRGGTRKTKFHDS